MPKRQFRLFGKSFTLNNGPFNMKEHTIIVIMANVNVAGEEVFRSKERKLCDSS